MRTAEAHSKEGVVTMDRRLSAVTVGLIAMAAYTGTCRADTIIDWDAKATAVASSAALGEREVAIVDLAMFDAVNSVARRYQPYLQQVPTLEPTAIDASAASAAEFSLTSPTAPGVTHRWSNLEDLTAEVANARIWAGFHYRFSTRVGTTLGRQVVQYVVDKTMQPVTAQR
jgi:hypothetical protein